MCQESHQVGEPKRHSHRGEAKEPQSTQRKKRHGFHGAAGGRNQIGSNICDGGRPPEGGQRIAPGKREARSPGFAIVGSEPRQGRKNLTSIISSVALPGLCSLYIPIPGLRAPRLPGATRFSPSGADALEFVTKFCQVSTILYLCTTDFTEIRFGEIHVIRGAFFL